VCSPRFNRRLQSANALREVNGCDPFVRGSLPLVCVAHKWELLPVPVSYLVSQSVEERMDKGNKLVHSTRPGVCYCGGRSFRVLRLGMYSNRQAPFFVTLIQRAAIVRWRSPKTLKSVRKRGINGPREKKGWMPS